MIERVAPRRDSPGMTLSWRVPTTVPVALGDDEVLSRVGHDAVVCRVVRPRVVGSSRAAPSGSSASRATIAATSSRVAGRMHQRAHGFSAVRLSWASPFSKSGPTSFSIDQTLLMRRMTTFCGRSWPTRHGCRHRSGVRVKSTRLCAFIGAAKRRSTATCCGSDSRISMRPSPALLLPRQA